MPDADTEIVSVSSLRKTCLYRIGYKPGKGPLCYKRATSVVVDPRRGIALGARCDEHEGLWYNTQRGEVLREIPQSKVSAIEELHY